MKTVHVDEARLRSIFSALLGGAGAILSASCAPADPASLAGDSAIADPPGGDATQANGDHDSGHSDGGVDTSLPDVPHTADTMNVNVGSDDGVDAAADETSTDAGGTTLCPGGADADQVVIDGAAYVDAADETAGACDIYVQYTGCAPFAPVTPTCKFNLGDCAKICGFATSTGCFVTPDNCVDGGIINTDQVVINCTKCLGGRRPARYRERAASVRDGVVGDWFARLAEIECASIAAFRSLREELRAHGAPSELLRRATNSARDEVRHTRSVHRLAARFGGRPYLPRIRRAPARSLDVMAIENVVEGCVRETYGALLAAWQAERAQDSEVRSTLRRIASEELEHAAFAWAVAAWSRRALGGATSARLDSARAQAVAELRAECAIEPDPKLIAIAGLPTAREAVWLLEGLAEELWVTPSDARREA